MMSSRSSRAMPCSLRWRCTCSSGPSVEGMELLDCLQLQIRNIVGVHRKSPMTRSTNTFEWRRDNTDQFGDNGVNENPAGHGTFRYAARFPGQYYDVETSLMYNMARDYDPTIGRYVEPDSIGLKGGMNTYAYLMDRPLNDADPSGLAVWLCERSTTYGVGNHSYFYDDNTNRINAAGGVPVKTRCEAVKRPARSPIFVF